MTPSSKTSEASDDDFTAPTPPVYKYDLRLEIGVKSDGSTVPVVAIFYDMVRRLKDVADEGAPVAVLTATDKLFHENKEMTSEEFQKAFQVDNFNGKAAKVLLGLKIHSMTKLADLKSRLMHTFLIPRNLFLRQHAGGFQNGVKSFNYGFLQHDHPDHPDIPTLNHRFEKLIAEEWKKLNKDAQKKWRDETPAAFAGGQGIRVPINFTKERLSSAVDNKEKLSTHALMVSTPQKFGKMVKALLDTAIAAKRLSNLIPFALARDNPNGYYYIVANQVRFMDHHRNIPIMNISADSITKTGVKGETLMQVLTGNSDIQRVTFDHQHNKYHVSTVATKYREVHEWIARELAENDFPYEPTLRPMKYTNGVGTLKAMSYSDICKDAISLASDNYTASTAKTTQSNAWKTRPPLAISYSLTDAAFPTLSHTKPNAPTTPSMTSGTFDEETFQSAISAAIKKLEDQHRKELDQLKKEMQNKIDEVTNQMKELGQQVATQTYQALVKKESPLATKTDHAQLQHDMNLISTQLSTIIQMFRTIPSGHNIFPIDSTAFTPGTKEVTPASPPRHLKRSKLSTTPEKSPRQHDNQTQDYLLSSAASDSEESMEGCEE